MKIAIGPSSFAEEDSSPLDLLTRSGCTILPNPFGRRLTEEETIAHLREADGLLAGLEPLNRRVLESAPHLKALARVGVGMENVDQEAARALGIKVSNTPEGPTDAVAEMTVAALLTLCRRIVPSNEALHAGQWKKIIGTGLKGLKVLLIGYGRIGRRVAELLQPFGSELLAYDPAGIQVGTRLRSRPDRRSAERPPYLKEVSLAEGLAQADALSLHAGGATQILGENEFRQMRDGIILLNSARGKLLDETALCRALDSGKIAQAWLDVFCEEPYKGPLAKYPQVLMTPHISTYTRQCRLSMETAAAQNLLRDLGISNHE